MQLAQIFRKPSKTDLDEDEKCIYIREICSIYQQEIEKLLQYQITLRASLNSYAESTETHVEKLPGDLCCICLLPLLGPCRKTKKCKHIFHEGCYFKLILSGHQCPSCRGHIGKKYIAHMRIPILPLTNVIIENYKKINMAQNIYGLVEDVKNKSKQLKERMIKKNK